MQFNTAYLKTLGRYGISPEDVARAGCYAYNLAAWRIRGHLIRDQGDIWTRRQIIIPEHPITISYTS